MEKETEKKVMNLEKKALVELRRMWKKVFGEEAPRLCEQNFRVTI